MGDGAAGPAASAPAATAAPPIDLLRALAVVAEPPGPAHDRLAGLLGLGAPIDASAYSDLFVFQLYPYASVHLGAEGKLGGEARERIAGFWGAVGRTPPAEPDHLAALLGLYAALAEEAVSAGAPAERLLRDRARAALLHEHLAPWLFTYLTRVGELSRGPYAVWADLLADTLRDGLSIGTAPPPNAQLPAHLALAPALPDPRDAGGSAFLDGLLAPVRSGLILTRADLAALARRLDLGLRAGERRYALEHLLAQDAPSVLAALSAEAGKRAAEHRSRAPWLGAVADFHARRATATAELLRALADEAGAPDRAGDADIVGAGASRGLP